MCRKTQPRMADNTIIEIGEHHVQEDRATMTDNTIIETGEHHVQKDRAMMADNATLELDENVQKNGEGGRDHGVSEAQAETATTTVKPQQGRGGQAILCSVIPCVVFWLWKLYLNRLQHRMPRPQWGRQAFISSRAFADEREENTQDDLHDNPQCHVIEMGLAENQLSKNLVQEWLASHTGATIDPSSLRQVADDNDNDGIPALKTAIAGYMAQVLKMQELLNESQIVLTAGSSSAMEILSFCLSEQAGDAFLVPSPYNPSFDRDIKWRTGVELVPVPCRSTQKFDITISALEMAYNRTRSRLNIRAILISNPTNPVGKILNYDTLQSLLQFAMDKNIHLICDETQAGSVYGSQEFTSMSQVLKSVELIDRSRVHIIYDLGIPEFRVGVLYSYNDQVMKAAGKLASRFSPVLAPIQHCLVAMLSDTQFLEKYMAENQRRLSDRFGKFTEGLKRVGIKYSDESNGGVYCWVEMGSLMQSYSEKGELSLWKRLLSEAKVNVTPGSACHCIEPGWFRFCFATVRDPDMIEALEGIQKHFLATSD